MSESVNLEYIASPKIRMRALLFKVFECFINKRHKCKNRDFASFAILRVWGAVERQYPWRDHLYMLMRKTRKMCLLTEVIY